MDFSSKKTQKCANLESEKTRKRDSRLWRKAASSYFLFCTYVRVNSDKKLFVYTLIKSYPNNDTRINVKFESWILNRHSVSFFQVLVSPSYAN